MPTISVPDPLATYIVYGVFLCLCFGQWVITFVVPARYGRSNKRRARRMQAYEADTLAAGAVHATCLATSSEMPNTSAILGTPHQPLETP